MPRKVLQPPKCGHYRLRSAASLLLAAGVWYCAARLSAPEPAGNRGTASTRVAPAAMPQEPPPVPAPPVESEIPSILIDPGHGGPDPGTVANGQYEKTWTLSVATALADALRAKGWPVEMTRTEDAAVALTDRSALSNRRRRLAFVSIHFNSGGPDATGLETYYAWPKNPEVMARSTTSAPADLPPGVVLRDDRGRLLAEALQSAACGATASRNRGARNEPGYAVLNHTECPAALVECGFLTSVTECAEIQTDAWRAKLVGGLASGLDAWLRESGSPEFGIVAELPVPVAPVTTINAGENR